MVPGRAGGAFLSARVARSLSFQDPSIFFSTINFFFAPSVTMQIVQRHFCLLPVARDKKKLTKNLSIVWQKIMKENTFAPERKGCRF